MKEMFKAGTIYEARSIGDHECVFSFTVLKRTSKRMTLKDNETGDVFVKGIYIQENIECCKPMGKYSFAPVIKANRPKKLNSSKKDSFSKWLDTFLSEKEIDLFHEITVKGSWGDNHMVVKNVIDVMKQAPRHEQRGIKDMIVKIDFHNGDVLDYIKHLAQAIAI